MLLNRSVGYIVIGLLIYASSAHANSGGAGQSACESLEPGHPGSPQVSPSPFVILLSKNTYTPGEIITVTLEGRCGEQFKGFLLQARRADPTEDTAELLGQFTPVANTQTRCSNAATPTTLQGLTHSNADLRTSVTVQWTAPSSAKGHVIFRCSFVKTYAIYWVNVTSGVLSDPSAPPLSVGEESIVSATVAPCSTLTTQTTTTGVSTEIAREKECGISRGCFDDCATGCTFTVSWAPEGNNIRFRLRSKSSGNSYMAIGFSSDKSMGDDSVAECVDFGGVIKAFQSYNSRDSNSRLANPEDGISDLSGSVNNGVFFCSFLRVTDGTSDSRSFSLTKDWVLFFAQGPANAGFSKSKHSTLPAASSTVTDFQSFSINGAASLDFPLVKAHGSLMSLAWLLCTGVGLVIARFFKPMWPNKTIGGVKIWFQVHRACMIATLLCTVIAFVIIFIEAEGYSREFDNGYQNAHPILGIIVTALVIINPIMALFRPSPTDSKRPIFNWAHFLVGKGAYVMAVITTFFGMTMDKAKVDDTMLYILAGYCVWQAIVEISLEIVRWRSCKKAASADVLPNGSFQIAQPENNQPSFYATINMFILGIHICVVSILTFTLIGLLATA